MCLILMVVERVFDLVCLVNEQQQQKQRTGNPYRQARKEASRVSQVFPHPIPRK